MKTLKLRLTGMDCADCATGIEDSVARLDGVSLSCVNFSTAQIDIQYEPSRIDAEKIKNRIKALGYGTVPTDSTKGKDSRPGKHFDASFLGFLFSRSQTLCASLAGILLIAAFCLKLFWGLDSSPVQSLTLLHEILLIFSLALAGYPIARSGLAHLSINRRININLLMTIATVGALVIGEMEEAATVIFLFAIGEALEGFTMERSRRSIRGLMNLAPSTATVLRPCIDCTEHRGRQGYLSGPCPFCGLHETQVSVNDLLIDETILIKPGERLPMDGVVVAGNSSINQAPITGESIPVPKGEDSEVFAGTINGQGTLEVRVTRFAKDTTLNQIIHLVEQAQTSRARTQRFVDRFASIYTPGVVLAAVLVAVIPPLFGQPFWNLADGSHGWLYRALTLLVISCPCALVISTPVTLVSAISAAARQGVLIKGGAFIETLAGTKVFAFDKTGTLTHGQPAVITTRSVDCENPSGRCIPCDDMLALAAAVEGRSEHPLAKAVVEAAGERAQHSDFKVNGIESLAGRGVRGTVNGKRITVGSHALFDADFPHDDALCRSVTRAESNGQTVMMISDGDRVRGFIAVADQVRVAGHKAIAELKELGIEKTIMLTGDNEVIARAIADGVGIDEVRANLLPSHKLEVVNELRKQYGHVAMVGDGMNDAPALASASVGIAMGAATAQAFEAADVALISNNLAKLPLIIRHSRAAMAVMKENITLSLAIKAIFIILALPGWATLWMAVFADMGASLLVTFNGMRLLRMRMTGAPNRR